MKAKQLTEPGGKNSKSCADGERLGLIEKVGYGLGDTASNILFQAWNFFLMIFYTDVFGLDAGVAAFMFLVTRLWDMITDPLMGMIADRTNTRWGKFRPYLLWMAVPFGVLACAMFITPDWGHDMKIVYAYASYILATMAYTAINIPYSSMMAVITPSPRERTTLSQYRFFFAFIGQLLITTFTLPLVKVLGNNPLHPGYNEALGYSQALGYQSTMMVFGAISITLLLITFLTTRERVKPATGIKTRFRDDLKEVVKNKPWLIIFAASVFWLIHNMIRNGMVAYYFNHVNGEGNTVLWSFSTPLFTLPFNKTTIFLTVVTLGMLAGVLLCTPLKRYFERKKLVIFLVTGLAVSNAIFYWLPPGNFILLCAANAIWAIFAGALPVFLFAMFADVTDYHEWKSGKRATGLITAGIMFAIKLGVAIGGFLGLHILGQYGYDSNLPVTPHVAEGIKVLFSLIPAAFILVCGIILIWYPLTDAKLEMIEKDLKSRKTNDN